MSDAADPAALVAGFLHPRMLVEHVFSAGGRCLTTAIRTMLPGGRFAGRALTVRTEPGYTRRPIEALDRAQRGDVLVMAAGGDSELSCWGSVVHGHAARKGVAGVVIDAPVRDLVEIRRLDPMLPLFARGPAPAIAGFGPPTSGAIGEAIDCGGVTVCPGDLVYGDDGGVAVVPWADVPRVLALAHKSIAFDDKEIRWVESGRSVHALIERLWLPDGRAYKDNKFRWTDAEGLDEFPSGEAEGGAA
jgi:4-hydroxy-4-methyl-2-oxoglutarate aldolase